MSRLTLAIAIAVFVICAAIAVMLYVALTPYFSLVGKIAIVCLIILAACAMLLALIFSYTKASNMIHESRKIRYASQFVLIGDIAVRITANGYDHLSAELERARVVSSTLIDTPDELPAIEGPEQWKYPHNLTEEEREKEVIAACNNGSSERAIADVLKISRDKVRKIKKKYGLLEA